MRTTPSIPKEKWKIQPGRIHGRLALLYWKPGDWTPTGDTNAPVTLDYPEGSIFLRQHTAGGTTITLKPRQGNCPADINFNFDQKDWQGIIEGYYEPDGNLRPGKAEPWVWIGHHRIDRRRFSTEQFETLCSNAQRLLQRVRLEKETFHPWLPIGQPWGLITIWEYVLIRGALLRDKIIARPFGSVLRNQADFGYQIVMSPKTTMSQLRGLFRSATSAK